MKKVKKFSLLTASVLMAGSLFSTPVFAETTGTTGGGSASTTATADIKGGSLTLNGSLSPISLSQTLNGSQISTDAQSLGSVEIIDARGTGAGYSLTASATSLTGGKAISGASIILTPGSVAKKDATSDDIPNLVSGEQTLTTNPISILNAGSTAGSEGKGSYTVNLGSLKVANIPANAYAGSYTANVTVTLNAAPTGQQ